MSTTALKLSSGLAFTIARRRFSDSPTHGSPAMPAKAAQRAIKSLLRPLPQHSAKLCAGPGRESSTH
jgi:hypothetical protein